MKSNLRNLFLLSLILTACGVAATNSSAFVRDDLPKFVATDDDRFNKTFREGRELIDREEWRKAADKFNEIACDCPEKSYVDAAFYWLAFCYKKLGRTAEMNNAIDRLLKNFPNSSWADDARILKLEARLPAIATSTGGGVAFTFPGGELFEAVSGLATTNPARPLDREDEIRLAAFQSLYATDQRRAFAVLSDMLKSGSKASESLKREVLRSLRTRSGWAWSSGNFGTTAPAESTDDKENLGLLRDVLVRGYQSESNVKIKAAILFSIAAIGDDQSLDFLSTTYRSESDKEVKKSIIDSLAWSGGTYFVAASAAIGGATTVGRGMSQSRSTVNRADETKSPRFGRVLEIFRSENDPELRSYALSKLKTFSGWEKSDGILDGLVRQYDAEPNEAMKISIINSFASLRDNGVAVRKLLDIAKDDKSDKLRLAAIRALQGSKNPEVAKFLEDLIK